MRARFASKWLAGCAVAIAIGRVVLACGGGDDSSSAVNVVDASLGATIDAGPLALVADDDAIDFGAVGCGQPIDPYDITFTNDGGATIIYEAGLEPAVSQSAGPEPADPFSLQGATSGIIGVGQSATVTVIAPAIAADASAGMYTATLVISDAYGHVPLRFPVTLQSSGGTIVAPALDTGAGSSGTTHVTNTGNAPVLVAALSPDVRVVTTWTGSPAPYLLQPGDGFDVHVSIYGSGTVQADLALVVTGGTCGASAATLSVKGGGSGEPPPDGSAPVTVTTGSDGGSSDAAATPDATVDSGSPAQDAAAATDAAMDAADGS